MYFPGPPESQPMITNNEKNYIFIVNVGPSRMDMEMLIVLN